MAETKALDLAAEREQKTSNEKPFRFMDLHPELRNTIYELVALSATTHIRLSKGNKPKFGCDSALMLVNKQFNTEFTSMLKDASSPIINVKIRNLKFGYLKTLIENLLDTQFENLRRSHLVVHIIPPRNYAAVDPLGMQISLDRWLSFCNSGKGSWLRAEYKVVNDGTTAQYMKEHLMLIIGRPLAPGDDRSRILQALMSL